MLCAQRPNLFSTTCALLLTTGGAHHPSSAMDKVAYAILHLESSLARPRQGRLADLCRKKRRPLFLGSESVRRSQESQRSSSFRRRHAHSRAKMLALVPISLAQDGYVEALGPDMLHISHLCLFLSPSRSAMPIRCSVFFIAHSTSLFPTKAHVP